jgi:hypothetical protein
VSETKSHAKAAAGRLLSTIGKALERVDEIRDEREIARHVSHQAQVREATTRTELTLALTEALIGRADAQGLQRAEAARRYLSERQPPPVKPRRGAGRIEGLLRRLGAFGQAALIRRSGLWRGTGRTLHDLRHIAAYVRRGADPTLVAPTLFDGAFYLAANPDVAASRASPLAHYVLAGAAEGRQPHPLFDPGWYAAQNAAELAATRLTPLGHFAVRGAAIARNPHPLFDVAHYAAQATDLAADEDPLTHYLREARERDLDPHPLFASAWYRGQLPRAARQVPPLLHYLTEGWKRGLTPHPLFDPAWYLEAYPDVAAAGLEPLAHFVTTGGLEGRSPSAWFDLPHYVAARGDDLPLGANPLVDYLQGGAWKVAEARPGFPTAAYLAQSPELVRQGLTPLEHWARRHGR